MSRYRLLILLPVLSSLIGRAQDDNLHVDADAQAWKCITATIQLIQQDRVAALAGRVVYPLIRENPLPDVTTRKEFGQVYNRLFDSTLKRVLVGLKPSDLFEHEGNWSYGQGDVWFDPEGKIIAINYSSPSEQQQKDSLTEETYRLLYPGIAHWKRNLLVCKVSKRLIRIDEVGDDLRYIAWGEGKTISEKPDLVLFKGVQEMNGTMGSYTITFLNGPWTYSFEYTAVSDDVDEYPSSLYLNILKNGKKIARYICLQTK
ncbi:hypothetical protein [Dinghuibacter silviterrae]|uniref:Uncharacterized protein n=1 Tax=Dinghuibacter silviterrae TaxID=1539049 RepID=A0A4R8DK53_9BACT|nr:hypothetical protein [Dinghuibacter silviterrae]TDW97556.1 hypothetical protein EDB95_5406 [Dinghuibacter silviterrae]